MKILILQDYLRCGGTENQSISIGHFLRERGHNTTLLTFRPHGVLRAKVHALHLKTITLQPFDTRFDHFAPRLIRTLKKLEPDIILCMGQVANAKISFMRKHCPSLVIIGSIRTGKSLKPAHLKNFHDTNAIITNTHWWKTQLEGIGIHPDKIKVIPNAITHDWDLEKLPSKRIALRQQERIAEKTCIFLNVARFYPLKRQRELIDAFCSLPENLDIQLWFIGDGPTQKSCQKHVKRNGWENRVKFWGYQTELLPYYAAADAAVSASLEDAQPNFLVEALHCGLPVIATDYRGVQECFVPNTTGFLIEPENWSLFQSKIELLATNVTLRFHIKAFLQNQTKLALNSHNTNLKYEAFFQDLLTQ